jgi:hypothetical protein
MTLIHLIKSQSPEKKWTAVFSDGKRVSFGAKGYEDYTQHHDKERRRLYRERHDKDLQTGDPRRAGFLSRYLLWGDSTDINTNLREYKRKFSL